MTRFSSRSALSSAGTALIVMVVILAIMGLAYVDLAGTTSSTQSSQASEIASLQRQLNALNSSVASSTSKLNSVLAGYEKALPLMDQAPAVRHVRIEWAEYQSGQDRFNSPLIVVNQGDTVDITYISNDTDAHTITIGPPYNFQINGSVPGTQDFLRNEMSFSTPPTHNSPGVVVSGKSGAVSGVGSFVAAYAGIYEYYCVYHVQLGMFGYLVVLPNAAYSKSSSTSSTATQTTASTGVTVDISPGSYNVNETQTFVPDTLLVVIGVNNTVTWVNNDIAAHTVTSTTGAFNSGNISPGNGWAYTFTVPGVYEYYCTYHTWMKGTVLVKQG